MIKLIRLEWKKHNIGKYIRNAFILNTVLLLLIIAMGRELDSDMTMELYGKSVVNAAVELFTHMSYIIFTSVMLSAFIVNAYENKTIHLMFSYPIKRWKILLSMIAAVWIFNFAALGFSKILIYAVLLLTRSYTHITATGIQMGELSFWLDIILSTAAMVSISYISLLVGLWAKSSKATIVTSLILVCCTQGNIGSYTLVNNIPFYIVLLLLSVLSIFLSVYNAETKDVN